MENNLNRGCIQVDFIARSEKEMLFKDISNWPWQKNSSKLLRDFNNSGKMFV